MSFDVSGKTVLITGAGRGIGRGIARVFGQKGAKVAINALTGAHVAPLAEDICSSGGEAAAFVADVTDSSAVDDMVREVTERFGPVDVLINNLGDSIRGNVAALEERRKSQRIGLTGQARASALQEDQAPMSDRDWAFIIDVNLTHAFYCCRTIGQGMLTRRRGKVINISSFSARSGGAGIAAYTAAKAGLVGLTRALALEWAPFNVQVNAIAPGSFPDAEALSEEAQAAADERAKERIPLGRVGRPEEVGLLALYLASEASDYMTGQTLYLDGGLSIK